MKITAEDIKEASNVLNTILNRQEEEDPDIPRVTIGKSQSISLILNVLLLQELRELRGQLMKMQELMDRFPGWTGE